MEPYARECKPANTDSAGKSYLDKLQTLDGKKEEKSLVVQIFQKILSKINEGLRSTCFHIFSKEHHLTLLTQENLANSRVELGSYNFFQKKMFTKLATGKESPGFVAYKKELENMNSLEGNVLRSYLPGGRERMAQDLFSRYKGLEVGEGMLIDLSSAPGHHAMKGRIIRDENGYRFQFMNTGAGLTDHPKFHKVEGKDFYQTIVEWESVNGEDVFTEQFFRNIIRATIDGKAPVENSSGEASAAKGEYGEELKYIDAIYQLLDTSLGAKNLKDIKFHRDSPYWSHRQESSSCVPQSFWAFSRVALSREEYAEIKLEANLRQLKFLYKNISSGNDRSSYARLLAHEQSLKLIQYYHEHLIPVPPVITRIRDDILAKLSSEDLRAAPLANDSKVNLSKAEDLPFREGKLVSGPAGLKVNFEEIDLAPTPISRGADNSPKKLPTLAHILYEAILNDNDEEIESALQDFTAFLADKASPADCGSHLDADSLYALAIMFYNLSAGLREKDGSFAGRPKQLAMHHVANTLYDIHYAVKCRAVNSPNSNDSPLNRDIDKSLVEQRREALGFCDNAGGMRAMQHYLGDNIWYKQTEKLRPYEMHPGWIGYEKRRELYDRPIAEAKANAEGGAISIDRMAAILPKKIKINGQKSIPVGETVKIEGYDFSMVGSEIQTKKRPYPGSNLPEVKISLGEDGKYTSDSLAGNVYLFYLLLVHPNPNHSASEEGNDVVSKNLIAILEKIQGNEIHEDDIPGIVECCNLLCGYCRGLDILDYSPESMCLQKAALKLSTELLSKCKEIREGAIGKKPEGYTSEERNSVTRIADSLTKSQSLLKMAASMKPEIYLGRGTSDIVTINNKVMKLSFKAAPKKKEVIS